MALYIRPSWLGHNRYIYILVSTSIIMVNEIVQKVWVNKYNGQKAVTIPKDSDINPGDWVEINKLEGDNEEHEN